MDIVEWNLQSSFLNLRHNRRAELHLTRRLWWSMTDIPHPIFNSVHHCRLFSDASREIEIIKTGGVPVLWRVFPNSEPADIAVQLERAGFADHGSATAMVIEWDRNAPASLVHIVYATDLEQWVDVFTRAYNMPEFLRPVYLEYYRALRAVGAPMYHYLAYAGDIPVCTGSLWVDGATAGFYNLGTLPEYRGMGYATAMASEIIRTAAEDGYCRLTLQAAPESKSLLKRIGFQEVGKIRHFVWEP